MGNGAGAQMQYRTHEDLTLSEIGFGCYALSGAYGPRKADEIVRVIRRAYEIGITFFDAAAAYGEAERILGETVRPFRNDVRIATKIGLVSGSRADLSGPHVRRSCEESLRRLQTDWIDLFQVHFDEPGRAVEETVDVLEDLAREGKIRRYGVGHLPVERVEAYCRTGRPFSVLMELSAVSRHAGGTLLPAARRSGVAAIAFSVTGRGILTGAVPPAAGFAEGDIRSMDPLFQRERLAHARRVAGRMREIGGRSGMTAAQVAIEWVLSQPGIVCALTGPSSIAHLEENAAASGRRIPGADACELTAFLDAEEARVGADQAASVERILSLPLPPGPEAAFVDLLYALETAVLLGRLAEARAIPLFEELFPLRGKADERSRALLEDLRRRISSLARR